MTTVDTGALAAHAGYQLRSGWIALVDLQPPGAGQPVPLRVTELPGAEVGLNWRNGAYAIQWVVFAGFVILFWNHVRREPGGSTRRAGDPPMTSPPSPPPPRRSCGQGRTSATR